MYEIEYAQHNLKKKKKCMKQKTHYILGLNTERLVERIKPLIRDE